MTLGRRIKGNVVESILDDKALTLLYRPTAPQGAVNYPQNGRKSKTAGLQLIADSLLVRSLRSLLNLSCSTEWGLEEDIIMGKKVSRGTASSLYNELHVMRV